MNRPFAAALLLILASCHGGPGAELSGAPAGQKRSVTDTILMRRVAIALSADAMLGRKTGTPGADSAAQYLAAECRTLGFQPIGTSWFQQVPLLESTIDTAGTRVRVTGPGVDTVFYHHDEFIVDLGTRSTLHGFSGELAYVGRAHDILFRRSELPPLEGKVALMRGEFGFNVAAADTLAGRGAVGVIEVVDDARRFRLFRQTRGTARLSVDDAAVTSSVIPPLPAIMAGPRMTVTLYQGLTGVTHGSWNDAYLNGLAAGLPSPQVIPGWRVDVSIATRKATLASANVGCLLPGRGAAADSALVVTAHLDHLGIGTPDEHGDSVYNGFFDNATGVGMALAVGDWFSRERAAGRGLRHSLILLFPTGEEQGLLGADYFATHPLWPLGRVTALFNFDANAPPGPPVSWRVAGVDDSPLVGVVVAGAALRGWTTSTAPAAPGSDYYPFLRRGVAAVFFVPSDGTYEGMSITLSDSLRTGLWTRYHQPGDEYSQAFGFAGLMRYADFTRDLLLRVDRAFPPRAPDPVATGTAAPHCVGHDQTACARAWSGT